MRKVTLVCVLLLALAVPAHGSKSRPFTAASYWNTPSEGWPAESTNSTLMNDLYKNQSG